MLPTLTNDLTDFALDGAWEDDTGDEEHVETQDKCACEGCTMPPVDGRRCEFCAEHCPRVVTVRKVERAIVGILAWRTHLVRDALDDVGVDPVEWWPFVLGHGSLDRAMAARDECLQLDAEFQRRIDDERS